MTRTQIILCFTLVILFSSCALLQMQQKTNIIEFSGYQWNIKSHKKPHGPSKNLWSPQLIEQKKDIVWVNINSKAGITSGSELWLKLDSLSYGYYLLHTIGNLDQLNKASVFGFFLYERQAPYREIDIEFGLLDPKNLQNRHYTVHQKNSNRPKITKALNWKQDRLYSTHVIKWDKKNISFGSYQGHLSIEDIKKNRLFPIKKSITSEPFQFELHINYWLKESVENRSFPKIGLRKFKYYHLD